jgi:predicted AAA+ superfamily ATPase
LLELLKIYWITGGMPAAVQEYLDTRNFMSVQKIQANLLQTYRGDFGKYARRTQYQHLERVFDFVPRLIGQRIKYSTIDKDTRSRDLKGAVSLLALSGMVRTVFHTSASGLPLGGQIDDKKFKLIFLDVGLMQNICGSQCQLALGNDLMQIHNGAVAEQYIGQELLAQAASDDAGQLYFWIREMRNSMAEVDFVISTGSGIFPVEVKAGTEGRLKSLRLFLAEKPAEFGIRFSQDRLSFCDRLLSVPLYMTEQLPRLIAEAQEILVKQGPCAGDKNKTRFTGVGDERVNVRL